MSRPCVSFVHSWSVGNFLSPPSTLLDLGATRPTLVPKITQTTPYGDRLKIAAASANRENQPTHNRSTSLVRTRKPEPKPNRTSFHHVTGLQHVEGSTCAPVQCGAVPHGCVSLGWPCGAGRAKRGLPRRSELAWPGGCAGSGQDTYVASRLAYEQVAESEAHARGGAGAGAALPPPFSLPPCLPLLAGAPIRNAYNSRRAAAATSATHQVRLQRSRPRRARPRRARAAWMPGVHPNHPRFQEVTVHRGF